MAYVTRSDILLIAYEGEFQLLKAMVLDVIEPPVAAGTPTKSQLAARLRDLQTKAYQEGILEVSERVAQFVFLLEMTDLADDMVKLRKNLAEAATAASALRAAAKIAKDGAAKLTVNGFNKGLEDLFKGLDVLKRGLDFLSNLGVGGKPFDGVRKTIGEALDAVGEKAEKEKPKSGASAPG